MHTHFNTRQRGLSMVEMLIALAISSFLILGVTQIYIDNKRNYIFQQNQSANQENGRFSLLLLEQELRKAGYRRVIQDSRELAFPAITVTGCGDFSAGEIAKPTANAQGVCFRYQRASNTELDCHGNLLPNNDPVTIRIEKTAAGELNCHVNGGPAATLITGLNQIVFEFGVDRDADRIANAYLSAADTLANTGSVVAVRYATLHESQSDQVALEADSYNFPLTNMAAVTPADRKLYKSVQGTTTLRNIAP